MSETKGSYRQIIKATSIFGGVQVFKIIIQIVRSKLVAILLGTEGMGINGLFNSSIQFISGLTNFGISISAVKNVAEANSKGDSDRIAFVIIVVRRIVWITGLLGAFVTIIFSKQISQLTFGNENFRTAFIWLSLTLLFNQLSSGQLVILQGMRKLKYLANANVTGVILGLIVSLPFYYYWGIDGIVPAIIISSIFSMLRSWYFARKIKIDAVQVTKKDTYIEGRGIIKMGFLLSLTGLFVIAKNYTIVAYISNLGGLEQVGLFSAGFALLNTYVGLVFTAMSTDYYPRLSEAARNRIKAKTLINHQAEITALILTPILLLSITFINLIIPILYSLKFISVGPMVQYATVGMLFRVPSWSMAFLFLARGDSKLYAVNEFIGGTITFGFHMLGYYFWGLKGWGIGFSLGYIYYTLQVYFILRKKYQFSFSIEFLKIFFIQFFFLILIILLTIYTNNTLIYIMGSILILVNSYYSFKQLDNRLNIKELIIQSHILKRFK